jgi:LPS export ABC transporter protein LptC
MRFSGKWPLRALLGAALILAAASGLGFLKKGPGNSAAPPAAPEKQEEERAADLGLSRVEHSATRKGAKIWALKAESLVFSELAKEGQVKDIDIVFYAGQGREARVTARLATIDSEANDVTLSGGVVLKDGDLEITTEEARYLDAERSFVAPGPVRLSRDGLALSGDRLEYGLDKEEARLTGHVSARFSARGRSGQR